MLMIAVSFFLTLSVDIFAATFTVSKLADTNDGVCNADCSLREAISAANLLASTDEIRFDAVLFQVPRTIVLTGGSLTIANNGGVTIAGPGPGLLTISGNNQTRVIVNLDGGSMVIYGVTIRDGNGNNIGAGGGIANSGRLILHNSVVRNNLGSPFAGGIYNGGFMQITDSAVIDNNGSLNGGGIYNTDAAGVLSIYNSTISGNLSRRDGGGIYNSGSVTIVNSTISNNTASSVNDGGNGGGVLTTWFGNQNSRVTIINSTIANNACKAGGGGILSDGSLVDLTNVTITGNSVTDPLVFYYGGGVINYQENFPGTVRAKNTIIADNTSANGQAPDFGGVLTSLGYNLIENTHWTAFTQPPQTDIFGQDPLLGPLSANGGDTSTRMPLAGSPVIDRVISGSPETDQRYYLRPTDGDGNGSTNGDIGAVEAGSSSASLTTRISGRVIRAPNRGDYPGQVQLIDNLGNVKYIAVNQFGYYRFANVQAGRTYILRVVSKRNSYLPKVIFVTGSVDSLNFSVGS